MPGIRALPVFDCFVLIELEWRSDSLIQSSWAVGARNYNVSFSRVTIDRCERKVWRRNDETLHRIHPFHSFAIIIQRRRVALQDQLAPINYKVQHLLSPTTNDTSSSWIDSGWWIPRHVHLSINVRDVFVCYFILYFDFGEARRS